MYAQLKTATMAGSRVVSCLASLEKDIWTRLVLRIAFSWL